MKWIAWLIQQIFRMLNQFAVEILTLPVDQCHFHHNQIVFCKSRCVIISTLSTRIASMELIDRGAASFAYSGEKWKTRARLRSEMPVRTVSERFGHPQWRRLFKGLCGRPTTTACFWSSLWQVPYASNLCLLEDKVQDRGMYLFTISYGSNAVDQSNILENPQSNDAWEQRLGWLKSCQNDGNFDRFDGEPMELEWKIFQDTIRCLSMRKSRV